nr:hypothetical protein [Anaerolineaceae bacterium]
MKKIELKTKELHETAIIIDGHNDILMSVADNIVRLGEVANIPKPEEWQAPIKAEQLNTIAEG